MSFSEFILKFHFKMSRVGLKNNTLVSVFVVILDSYVAVFIHLLHSYLMISHNIRMPFNCLYLVLFIVLLSWATSCRIDKINKTVLKCTDHC